MHNNHTVYILDPTAAQVKVAVVPDLDMKTIKTILGYDAVDTLHLDSGHLVYFNDNGLQQGITHYVTITGQPDPFVGRILFVAHVEGRAETLITLNQACAMLSLFRPVMDPIVTSSRTCHGDQTTFVSVVEGFRTRIERVELEIVTGQASDALPLN